MMSNDKRYNIVYCTPALYMAGGVERVLTLKANYFAEQFGYDITIILTEGKDKPFFYPLSKKVNVVNLNIGFEELWNCSFIRKIFVYIRKQHQFKKKLTAELLKIRPDITISLLRREINFINDIKDGSLKIGELHVNRANYRNFEENDTNCFKSMFAKLWMNNLVGHLRKLDKFVVLTEEDKHQWKELCNVKVIPDPLSFPSDKKNLLSQKRVIAVGRYVYQKGFDLLLMVWSKIEKLYPDWELAIYGQGNREPYDEIIDNMSINRNRCHLYGPSDDIKAEYLNSSIFVLSSRFEGFGMVLLEAMACGLPCISFACPCGPRDIISNGQDGYLVPNGDVNLLADKLSWLMSHPNKIPELSVEAVKKSSYYSIDHLALKWKSLFESIL